MLTPKAFAVAKHLVANAARLVTKKELLDTVWADSFVGDAVLKVAIREIRIALGEETRSPRFIETVHRRGYRFIAKLEEDAPTIGLGSTAPALEKGAPAPPAPPPPANVVGRQAVLDQLRKWLDIALGGKRQVVFITGEPGLGKTTVVDAFLATLAGDATILRTTGQCIEHFGMGEPYMPVLEAMGRLCRGEWRERLTAFLGRHAPTWLAQMPWLVAPAEREVLEHEVLCATRERMLRELAEALEVLTSEIPLVLILEDLHWSDYSTVDLLSLLVRRQEPARLLVVGTYRPAEVKLQSHPLRAVKQELELHGMCREIQLDLLDEAYVSEYLSRKFPSNRFSPDLARLIHQRTEGNPLFIQNVVEYLVAREVLVQRHDCWEEKIPADEIDVGVPESLRQMLGKQIDRLGVEERSVVEAASVAGVEFATTAVAAALEMDAVRVEAICETLSQNGQLLRPAEVSEMPDGTVASRYRFVHWLFQDVLCQRVSPVLRGRLHLRIAEHLETAYRSRAGAIAHDLATHFEAGRDFRRAIHYLRRAAENDTRRFANREAIDRLTRALELESRLPDGEAHEIRIALLEQMGLVRRSMGDMQEAARDFEAMARAARDRGDAASEVRALLCSSSVLSWLDRSKCLLSVQKALELSRSLDDDLLRAHTRGYAGYWNLLWRGWRDEDAEACLVALEKARAAGNQPLLLHHVARYSFFQCLRSQYREACASAREGLQLAVQAGDAFDYLLCQFFLGWALFHLGQWGEMQRVLKDAVAMAEKNVHRPWALLFRLELAWLHEQAGDYGPVRRIAEEAFEEARSVNYKFGELFSLILLGFAHLGERSYDKAFECFMEIRGREERGERTLMDWIWYMPLGLGLSRYWLEKGDYEKARSEAEALLELASRPAERTYVAFAQQRLAEISLADGRSDQAEAEMQKALATLEGTDAPLACWRVHVTAKRLYKERGMKAAAKEHGERAVQNLLQLASSLTGSELRSALLSLPAAKAVLGRASPIS